ncbi:hypothetical protein Tco_0449338 [Tanacetum coccineum]
MLLLVHRALLLAHNLFSPVTCYCPPGFHNQHAQPTHYIGPLPMYRQTQLTLPVGQLPIFQPAQLNTPMGHLPSFQRIQPIGNVGQPATQFGHTETTLPHAFSAVTLQDLTNGAWNMDTGASSHLNSSITSISDVFNTCIYPSVSVGDGHSIPITNTGHSILPIAYGSLHLNNVLITPNIFKNLISMRQFVRDNNCTIEFDAFGFSVKDFTTRRVLLRCDSTRDL